MCLLCAEGVCGHWSPLPSRLTKHRPIFTASAFMCKAQHDRKQSLVGGPGLAVPDSRRRSLLPGDTVPRRKAPACHRGTDVSEGGTARVLELSPFKPWTSYFRTSATSKLYTLETPLSKILTRADRAQRLHLPTRSSVISGKRSFKSSATPSFTGPNCLRFLSLRSTTKTSPSQGSMFPPACGGGS